MLQKESKGAILVDDMSDITLESVSDCHRGLAVLCGSILTLLLVTELIKKNCDIVEEQVASL
jgi:hypothetical protein